jgi:hypothetical protein
MLKRAEQETLLREAKPGTFRKTEQGVAERLRVDLLRGAEEEERIAVMILLKIIMALGGPEAEQTQWYLGLGMTHVS